MARQTFTSSDIAAACWFDFQTFLGAKPPSADKTTRSKSDLVSGEVVHDHVDEFWREYGQSRPLGSIRMYVGREQLLSQSGTAATAIAICHVTAFGQCLAPFPSRHGEPRSSNTGPEPKSSASPH